MCRWRAGSWRLAPGRRSISGSTAGPPTAGYSWSPFGARPEKDSKAGAALSAAAILSGDEVEPPHGTLPYRPAQPRGRGGFPGARQGSRRADRRDQRLRAVARVRQEAAFEPQRFSRSDRPRVQREQAADGGDVSGAAGALVSAPALDRRPAHRPRSFGGAGAAARSIQRHPLV